MIIIRQITPQESYPVRQAVLRPGKPLEQCVFDGDELAATTHLGVYEDDSLAGILSIFKVQSPLFRAEEQYQLRGMAILETHQKKGLGEKLVREAEKLAVEEGGELIWFNAREAATGFYNKMGYATIGNQFFIENISIHYTMFKILS